MSKNNLLRLTTPVTSLTGVGPGIAGKLKNLGIGNIQDLLFHLPYRYVDRTRLLPIGGLLPGEERQIQGRIELTQIHYGRRRTLLCHLSDGTGAIVLRFFHFSQSQQAGLQKGVWLRCWGQIRRSKAGLEMIHPEYRILRESELDRLEDSLTPVYPATEGLAQVRLRKLISQALAILEKSDSVLEELVPLMSGSEYGSSSLKAAIQYLHRPPPDADIEQLKLGRHPAQQRLAMEELLAQQLSLRMLRESIQKQTAVRLENFDARLTGLFLSRLPFNLTAAQKKVMQEIGRDLDKNVPMLRLVQGDVGSGKTVIAAYSAIRTISAGYQVALMAPTELLADQHYYNLNQWLSDLDIQVVLLTGKLRSGERRKALELIRSESPLAVIGTHALFQEDPEFGRLALVIIDEQHRFGVHQRLALIEKGSKRNFQPHQLIMTATPIPRTLAMTVFGDLDISIIDELPPGRQPVTTAALSSRNRDEIINRITSVCDKGHQVYWVCTLIDESETLQCRAAVRTSEYLADKLPQLKIALVHGRQKRAEREQMMRSFKNGEVNVLVATTVIEVGVDVPNANLMIIENAERLGLAQLHQLRGRVGRGKARSNCVLLYHPPLSELAAARLEIMRCHSDGFIIAEKDLELRGPGDLLGTRQTGIPQMRIADIVRDAALLPRVRDMAEVMLKKYPRHSSKLIARWLSSRVEYTHV